MNLVELQLRNWRSYKNATFSLPEPKGKKNVILVGAQNGVGKTSFLMALYLGLYGREALELVEGFRRRGGEEDNRSYKKLIESIIHRPACREDEPHCSVRLKFIIDGEIVQITRRWNFTAGGRVRDLATRDGEETVIERAGRKRLCDSWQDASSRIQEELFPPNVMPCLFFDGEQAQARVDDAGKGALFDAVKALYGTGILDQLSESLRTFIGNERDSLRRDVGVVRIDELTRRREELEDKQADLSTLEREIAQTKSRKGEAEAKRGELENELYSLVGDKVADIEEYANTMSALQSEEAELKGHLISKFGAISAPLLLLKHGKRIAHVLEREIKRENWLLLKDQASGKAAGIVEQVFPEDGSVQIAPALSAGQSVQLRALLEKALESLWSPPPDGCDDDFIFPFLKNSDREVVLSKVARYGNQVAPDVADTVSKLRSNALHLRETKLRFDRVRDVQPALAQLKKSLEQALEEHREAANNLSVQEARFRGLQEDIANLRATIGQMETRQQAVDPVQQKLDVASKVRAIVEEAKEQLIPLCKVELEDRCTKHFQSMISKEYTKFSAKFALDSEPWLESVTGDRILISSMSGAQKRAFGLAFTLAVADVSQQAAPIVIDTPVGNMDSEYRSRILKYVMEAAPGQVIILSHNEEVYGRYKDAISPRIAKTFLVEFSPLGEGFGVSSVIDNEYFPDDAP